MSRVRFAVLVLIAVSTLSAQETFPDAGRLLNRQWVGGDWRTIQYVAESSGGTLTVALEKPNKLRAELKATAGFALTVVSDGQSTWIYNSSEKRYSRLSGGPEPAVWLVRLNELLVRQMMGSRGPLFVTDYQTNLTTVRSEIVRVGNEDRDCWVVQGASPDLGPLWNTRIAWIDKSLSIPIKFGGVDFRKTREGQASAGYLSDAKLRSLQVDDPIPASFFEFRPRSNSQEVPAPSHLLSTSTSASPGQSIPGAETVLKQAWTGNWQTIQYTAESRRSLLSAPNDHMVIRTTVSIEKPDRIRVEMNSLREGGGDTPVRESLTIVSDDEATWISNSVTKQYAKLSNSQQLPNRDQPRLGPPVPRSVDFPHAPLLRNLEELWVRQLFMIYGIGNNPDMFADLANLLRAKPMYAPINRSPVMTTLRSEIITVNGEDHDCWVVLSSVRDLGPRWNTRIVWIDKNFGIPLRFGALSEILWTPKSDRTPVFLEPQLLSAPGNEPEFVGGQVLSLKIDEAMPPKTFTFNPPKSFKEVPAPVSARSGVR